MIKKVSLPCLLFALLLCACSQQPAPIEQTTNVESASIDTIIGSKVITDEIAGSAYRKRAKGYFVIIGKDTSDYTCIFSEAKDEGKVYFSLYDHYAKDMSYTQRLKEVQLILPKAATEFNLDSLSTVSLGRLVSNTELAIEVTEEYHQKFGAGIKLQAYDTIVHFLKTSKLGKDINALLNPYGLIVDKVSIEKLFFTEATTGAEPVLDCITWVSVKQQ